MSIIEHILLYCILFGAFYTITKIRQNNLQKSFWTYVLPIIFLYSLILGCRYGWGNDYFWYKSRIEHPFQYESESLGFGLLNQTLKDLGFNYVFVYIIYSLIFILCGFYYCKDFKYNKYMLALFLPATIVASPHTIRQSLGHSFIFLCLLFINRKKWLSLSMSLLLAYSIHSASILLLVLPVLFFIFYNKPISYKITVPIYVIASVMTITISEYVARIATGVLPLITLNNKFNGYLHDDSWFGKYAINEDWQQGIVTLTLSIIFHVGIIYLGYIALHYKPNKAIAYVYNTVIIGFILLRCFWCFEIFNRMVLPYTILYFVPLGYAFYILRYTKSSLTVIERKLCNISSLGIILYLVLYFGRFIFLSPDYLFFWNATNS